MLGKLIFSYLIIVFSKPESGCLVCGCVTLANKEMNQQ